MYQWYKRYFPLYVSKNFGIYEGESVYLINSSCLGCQFHEGVLAHRIQFRTFIVPYINLRSAGFSLFLLSCSQFLSVRTRIKVIVIITPDHLVFPPFCDFGTEMTAAWSSDNPSPSTNPKTKGFQESCMINIFNIYLVHAR